MESYILDFSEKNKRLRTLVTFVDILFTSFIGLCGLSHLLSAIQYQLSPYSVSKNLITGVLVLSTFVSCTTALVLWKISPIILESFGKIKTLEKEKFQLIQVVEACHESIVILTSSFKIVRGNSITESFFGNNYVGTSILDYISILEDKKLVKDALYVALNSKNKTPLVIEYRVNNLKKSAENINDNIWLETSILKQLNEVTKEVEITMMTRNIDERKQAENLTNFLAAGREQNRVNEAKLMYINCVAHDLKTPLQSFSFALDLIENTPLNKDQREYLDQARVNVDLMKLTISQAMHIGKALSGGKVIPRVSSVSLISIFRRVQIVINGCGSPVPILYHIPESVKDQILTDEEWLWQMLLNLLTNACKYTETGEINVYLEEADDSKMLLFKVKDTGIGIAEYKIDKIFDAFSQAQEGQIVGTGLGLFGVRSRAIALGGSCGVRNNTFADTENGAGCTFWFKIPYIRDSLSSYSSDNQQSTSSYPSPSITDKIKRVFSGESLHQFSSLSSPAPSADNTIFSLSSDSANQFPLVLNAVPNLYNISKNISTKSQRSLSSFSDQALHAIVVDDTLSIRKLLTRILEQLGFTQIESYENGARGLEAMKQTEVDIVFTDIQMPVMSGPEVHYICVFTKCFNRSFSRCYDD